MAHAVNGAMYCSGAASLAVAATIIEYFNESLSSSVLTSCATVERFCPTATYTQYNFLVSSEPSFQRF